MNKALVVDDTILIKNYFSESEMKIIFNLLTTVNYSVYAA